MHNFQPGEYVARVRAVSPAGVGDWSKDVTFVIEAPEVEKDNTLVLGVSIGVAVLILVLIAFVIYYSFFRRYVFNSSLLFFLSAYALNQQSRVLPHS